MFLLFFYLFVHHKYSNLKHSLLHYYRRAINNCRLDPQYEQLNIYLEFHNSQVCDYITSDLNLPCCSQFFDLLGSTECCVPTNGSY